MGYGTSLGTAHEDEISYVMEKMTSKQLADQKEMAANESSGDFQSRFYATDASTMPLEASRKLTDALKQTGSTYLPVEDRRGEDNSPAWDKVLPGLKEIGVTLGNNLWGTPSIPEAPVSDLSRKLGHEDIKIDPNVGRSLLHRAVDDVQLGANLFGLGKGEAWSDKEFSKGTTIGNKLFGTGGEERFQTWPERQTPEKVLETNYLDKLKSGNDKTMDFLFGKGENDIRPALGHMAETVKNAFALPGDVYSGKVQAGSVQEIERAFDLAGLMVMGPAPVAAKLADGTLGSFGGVRSMTGAKTNPELKTRLYEAQTMELDAMHPDDIWTKTGFFRGADQRWRYEIPDKDAKLKMDAFDTIIEQPTQAQLDSITWTPQGDKIVPKDRSGKAAPYDPKTPLTDYVKNLFKPNEKPTLLPDIIDHPELFKAYPELGTMKVEPLPKFLLDRGVKGQVSGDTIYLAPGHPEYIRSVILHEVQHGIQHHEGFAFGGTQEQFLPKELPQAEKEFLAIKQSEEPKIADALVTKDLSMFKRAIEAEQSGLVSPMHQMTLSVLKEKYPAQYKKLTNIVKSETLLREAKGEAFTKYTRLMGEVEARNVQTRMNFTEHFRKLENPRNTEDVLRTLQINPK